MCKCNHRVFYVNYLAGVFWEEPRVPFSHWPLYV
jgi:hypothetical protein